MNNEEKKVLRRKRQTLVVHLKVTEKHLEHLIRSKHVTQEGADMVRGELSNQAKVNKLLEVIPTLSGRRTFQAICELLELGNTSWLKDELQAEVKAEKGDLKLEEYIERECGVLVYREFGNSKRLSEGEKKDMLLLMAKKTQCTKEAWRSQLLKTEEALAYENELNKEKDDISKTLIDRIKTFLKINTPRLRIGGRTAHTTSIGTTGNLQHADSIDREPPLLEILDHLITDLENLAMDGLLERDQLWEERNRSLQILSVIESSAKLDREIDLALQDADHRLRESYREVDQNETKAKAFESELTTTNMKWHREVEQRDNSIKTLRNHLEKCHEKIRDLNECMENLQHDLANTKDELAKYRNKSELLEKSRRLGYGPGAAADKALSDLDKNAWRRAESRISTAKSSTGSVNKKTKKPTKTSRN